MDTSGIDLLINKSKKERYEDLKIKNKKKKIYGLIYLATNILNNKVYVGKVKLPKTIKKRWKEHQKKGEKLKKKRLANPNKKIWSTHLNNGIAKYSPDIWYLTQIDVAYSREELNEKERYWIKKYKSNDPQYGYNMTEGGEGGTPNKESLKKISEIVTEKWKDPEYREKIRKTRNTPEFKEKFSKSMSKATSKMWKNPIFREKVSNSIKEKWKDPEYKEKVSKKISNAIIEKWEDSQYREKVINTKSKDFKKKWQNPKFRRKMIQSHIKPINDRQFLFDIKKNLTARELAKKYFYNSNSMLYRRLKYILGEDIDNLLKARDLLRDQDINDFLCN